jgi:predicted Zn-ribbon and HTH transcriptional regulator
MESDFLTTRERIIELLRSAREPLTAEDIVRILGLEIPVREVYEHLLHIAKTIRSKSQGREVLLMEPPVCRKCGYVFRDLDKPKKPSRCPRCKSEWISPPRFIISCE